MIHKSGGIYFWKLGRVGGSFYVKRRRADRYRLHEVSGRRLLAEITAAAVIGIPAGAYIVSIFL